MPGRFHNLELEQPSSEISLLTEKREFEPDEYLNKATAALHRTQYETALQINVHPLPGTQPDGDSGVGRPGADAGDARRAPRGTSVGGQGPGTVQQ
jgi:hypothetical protein